MKVRIETEFESTSGQVGHITNKLERIVREYLGNLYITGEIKAPVVSLDLVDASAAG